MGKRVERTRANGTMTEAAFWAWIRSALRQKSRWWKPIAVAKNRARRLYKGPRKRQKYEYQCNICKEWFPEKKVNVDHITPAGSLNCAADLPGFVERLFCEADDLQCLCEKCHNVKTKQEKDEQSNNTNTKRRVANKRRREKPGGEQNHHS